MKIGFFDSGKGGKEILNSVRTYLPQYSYVYYADTANVPYGEKSESEIYELTKLGVEYLFEQDCSLVILACNTASAETARKLQVEYLPNNYPDRKVLGVIIPTVEVLHELAPIDVLLLATSRTVESAKYQIELHKIDSTINLTAQAMPELVPLIESDQFEEAARLVERSLDIWQREGGVVVFGCTHYSALKSYIDEKYFDSHTLLFQTDIVPKKLQHYLEKHAALERDLERGGEVKEHQT